MVTWVILVIYFGLILALGVVAEKRSRGLSEFFVASRRLGWFVLAMTWFATAYSGSTFIGFGGFVWKWGWAPIVFLAAEICTPLFQFALYSEKIRSIGARIKAVTLPDLMAHRYNSDTVRVIVAGIIILFSIPMMIVQFTAAGRLFEGFIGLNYTTAVVVFAGIVAVYTAMGGFLADAWSDTMQGVIMLIGTIVLVVRSLSLTGGMTALNAKVAAIDPQLMTLPGPGNYMPWTMAFSQLIIWTVGWTGQPGLTTRFLAMKDRQTGKRAMLMGAIAVFLTMGLLMIPGLASRVLFPELANPDLAFPTLLTKVMSPIGASVFVCAVLAAAMSTCDSVLLITAGAFTRDIYQKVLNRKATDEQIVKLSKIATLALGLITMLGALKPMTLITMIMIFVTSGFGIFTIPLTFGLYWKRGTAAGAVASMVSGFVWLLYQYFVMKTNPLGLHPYIWTVVISSIAYVVVSLYTKPVEKEHLSVFFPAEQA